MTPSEHIDAWERVQAKRRERERHQGPLSTCEAFRPGSAWFGSLLGPVAVVVEDQEQETDGR